MQLIPAIDLLDGRCVRLRHGDFDRCEAYDDAPGELAAAYAASGAEWLHVVDLAASRDGRMADPAPLFELLSGAPQKVQTGGGVREAADIAARLDCGAARVVVGSIAVNEPGRFLRWLGRFGTDRLVAALDLRIDGEGVPRVRSHGWTRDSGRSLWSLLEILAEGDLRHLLCTDIARDGAMSGPNTGLYRSISNRYPKLCVQASGGVRSVDDLTSLAEAGAAAAIVGKALLDGRFTVEQALEAVA